MASNGLGAAAAGADMLQEILQQKFAEAMALKNHGLAIRQQDLNSRRMDQEDAYRRDSLKSLDDSRQFAQQQAMAKAAEQEKAVAAEKTQAQLRAAIQGSQNVAGTDDPNGSPGTRNALRVALTAGGAKPNEIPQEPQEAKPKLYAVQTAGPDGKPLHKLVSEQEMQQGVPAYREPKAPASSAPRGLTPTAEANLTTKLADEWTKTTAASREMERQFNLMQTGISRFQQGDKNGGSQAVLVTFQKILDPTSVVRESEYARSSQGVSMLQRMQGYAEQLQAGGAGVPEAALKQMVQTAAEFLAHSRKSTEGQRKRLQMFADKYGIPQELVFDDAGGPASAAPAAPAAAPSGGDGRIYYDANGNPIKK